MSYHYRSSILRLPALLGMLCLALSSSGQTDKNLVKNPGFERVFKYVPAKMNYLGRKGKGNQIIESWYAPGKGSPEVYPSVKVQLIQPSEGKNHAGYTAHKRLLGMNIHKGKEYLLGTFKEPLEEGKAYCICMDVALHRTSKWAVTNLGIKFQDDIIFDLKRGKTKRSEADVYLDRSTYTTNQYWRSYCTTYIAEGGEKSFLFGTFGKTKPKKLKKLGVNRYDMHDVYSRRAYYMVDNFQVKPLIAGQCGCGQGQSEQGERNTTTLVLDASSSMREMGVFDTLTTRLRDWVNLMDDEHLLTIVEFASEAKTLYQGRRGGLTDDMLDAIVEEMKLSGGTNVYKGLSHGYKRMAEIKPEHEDSANVVLVTDGRFTVNDKMKKMIRHYYTTKGAHLTVVHVNNRADEIEQLKGLGVTYYSAKQRDFSLILTNLYAPQGDALACKCQSTYIEEYPKEYTFVLDHSGSMSFKHKPLKKHLDYCIDQLPDTTRISIMSFNTRGELLFSGTKEELAYIGTYKFTNQANMDGGTAPETGMERAYNFLASNPPKPGTESCIVMLSDIGPSGMRSNQGLYSLMYDNYQKHKIRVKGVAIKRFSIKDKYYEYYPLGGTIEDADKENFCDPGTKETKSVACSYRTQRYAGAQKPTNAVATVFWSIVGVTGFIAILAYAAANSDENPDGQ